MVALLVGLTLALAVLRSVNAGMLSEQQKCKRQTAVNLAEAGLDYGYYQIAVVGRGLPYSASGSLGTGTYAVTASDNGNENASVILLTATGNAGGYRHTARKAIRHLPYYYACCLNSNLSTNRRIITNGPAPCLRVNGSISNLNLLTNINAGAWATGTIATWGYISPQNPNCPPIGFPTIDYGYYQSIAARTYTTSKAFTNLGSSMSGVTYVQGNVDMSGGTYGDGAFTIVATGDIDIKHDVVRNGWGYLALISTRRIKIETAAQNVEAVLYSHKPDNNGEVRVEGSWASVTGVIAGDRLTTSADLQINRDDSINIWIMKYMHLPGLE